ncbi:S8 family serine peptidase [Streptomyces sp. NPDC001514]
MTLVPTTAAAAEEPVALPTVRSVLGTDEKCAGASGQKAEAEPWTRSALSLNRAWPLSQGEGVLVAVVDTGVGAGIPALQGRVTAIGPAGTDCVGHGSFAAGLIAAAPLPGSGVAGAAPRARILAVRCTDERGRTDGKTLAAGIRQAADLGARVVYVGKAVLDGRDELTSAVAHAARKDVLVVAPVAPDFAPRAAGSGQVDPQARPYFPAFVPQVLSVVDHGQHFGRPKDAPQPFAADLSAPGDAVVSVGPQGEGHYFGSGSSYAAAHVAGAAALVRARNPELTATQTAARLVSTAYPADVPRLDPYAALTAVRGDTAAAAAAPPVKIEQTRDTARAARTRAYIVAAAALLSVLLIGGAVAVVPRGRRRSWRAAGS